nr:EmeA [Acremonium sp.]
MKATGIISVATLATAASAAPILGGILDTVEGIVGGLPIVGDILERVPVTDLLDGIFARLPVDELVESLPLQDIVQQLPIGEVVQALPLQPVLDAVNAGVVGPVADILPVKRGYVGNAISGIPLVGSIIDSLDITDLLDGILDILPVDGIAQRLPAQDIIESLPVQDIIARLPISDVVQNLQVAAKVDVKVNKRAALDVPVELPLVKAILDRIPVKDLLNGVVARVPVKDIVAQLPVKDIAAHLPAAEIVKALPVASKIASRDIKELNVVTVLEQTVVKVKEHTKVINVALEKVDTDVTNVNDAAKIVYEQVSQLKVVLVDTVKVVANDAALPLVKVEVERVVEVVKTLLEEILTTVLNIVKALGLRAKIATILHEVFTLLADLLSLVVDITSELVPGIVDVLNTFLSGLQNSVLIPVATPLVAFAVGLVH